MIAETTSTPSVPALSSAPRYLVEQEFDVLYRQNGRALMSYITRMCGDATLAEDLFQKTFFQFLRVPVPADDPDHLRAYLYRTATNVITDHWRKHRHESAAEVPERSDGARSVGENELRHDMRKMLDLMSPQERALLWFAHVEELEHREIARSVGVKEKSVKVLLYRARKKLASLVQQKGLFGGTR
jgi:RNA polymerase sigma-70 factor, ECF subfamily